MAKDEKENGVVFILPNRSDLSSKRRSLLIALSILVIAGNLVGTASAQQREPLVPVPDDPTSELSKLIDRADRIVVKQTPSARAQVLFESNRRVDLDELKGSLIVLRPKEWVRCGCAGAPAIYLYSGGRQVGLITNQHGERIRFVGWDSDLPLPDPLPFLDWFAKRGMAGPKEEFARGRKIDALFGAAQKKWIEAMPGAIRPLWETALKEKRWFKEGELREALAKGIPDRNERIRALFAWYGSGMGQWSGFPAYESFAEELLLEYPTTELVAALQGAKLSAAHLEGASRLFGTFPFTFKRAKDYALLPADLKRQLRDHCLASPEEYQRKLAGTVFKQD